jgi:hypothetical protein
MVRKTTTQHARSLAEMDAVEIKVTIRPDQELRAERSLEINEDNAEVRIVYFYDTPGLELFDAGIALRARLVKGDDDDSTVKVRPVEAAKVADEWKRHDAFKLEADCVGRRIVCSASLTVLQKRTEIDKVAKGTRPIEKLFSKDQERFLTDLTGKTLDFGKLHVLGPIRVLRWKVKAAGFPYDLTVEEWRLPDGEDLVEVSFKAAPRKALLAQKKFEAHLRGLGLDPEGAQETKTRTALSYFAKAVRKARTSRGAARERRGSSRTA